MSDQQNHQKAKKNVQDSSTGNGIGKPPETEEHTQSTKEPFSKDEAPGRPNPEYAERNQLPGNDE